MKIVHGVMTRPPLGRRGWSWGWKARDIECFFWQCGSRAVRVACRGGQTWEKGEYLQPIHRRTGRSTSAPRWFWSSQGYALDDNVHPFDQLLPWLLGEGLSLRQTEVIRRVIPRKVNIIKPIHRRRRRAPFLGGA